MQKYIHQQLRKKKPLEGVFFISQVTSQFQKTVNKQSRTQYLQFVELVLCDTSIVSERYPPTGNYF